MLGVPRSHIRKKIESPCLGCEKREVGCHGSCERYADYKEEKFTDYIKVVSAYRGERNAEEVKITAALKTIKESKKGKRYF